MSAKSGLPGNIEYSNPSQPCISPIKGYPSQEGYEDRANRVIYK